MVGREQEDNGDFEVRVEGHWAMKGYLCPRWFKCGRSWARWARHSCIQWCIVGLGDWKVGGKGEEENSEFCVCVRSSWASESESVIAWWWMDNMLV